MVEGSERTQDEDLHLWLLGGDIPGTSRVVAGSERAKCLTWFKVKLGNRPPLTSLGFFRNDSAVSGGGGQGGCSPRCSWPNREQKGLLVAVSVTYRSQGHKAREETEE